MSPLSELARAFSIDALDATNSTDYMLKETHAKLNVILRTEEQTVDSIRVVGIGATHVRLSGADLPVKIHSVVELELSDEMLRMTVQVTVESKDAFGLIGRWVQPGNLFQDWITSITD